MILCFANAGCHKKAAIVRRTWTHADVVNQLHSKTKTTDMRNVFENDADYQDYKRVVAAKTNVLNNFKNKMRFKLFQ